ncbi:MAG: anthranilate synthase component I [Rhodothermales bacterium]
MTFETFSRHVSEGRSTKTSYVVVPVTRRLSADLLTPVLALLRLRESGRRVFLFESVEGGEKLARYSFLGRDPALVLRGRGQQTDIEATMHLDSIELSSEVSVLDNLRALFSSCTEVAVEGLPRFTGGAVGYLGYDGVRLFESIPQTNPATIDIPESLWAIYRSIIAFDHVRHQLVLIFQAFVGPDTSLRAAYDEALKELNRLEADLDDTHTAAVPARFSFSESGYSRFDRKTFEAAVEDAKHHIREGDIFQIVLSRRAVYNVDGDPVQIYRALRQVNPSPYLFYLDTGDCLLIGSSPEVLVRVEDGRGEVLPIAGTRPRGTDEETDRKLADELLADPKERAEHVMLVDLGRNDLGRVCEPGTVSVDRYAFIERYSHVMHIVSSVSGQMRPECGPLDALTACFPAGTVSGAPKVRAMELIDHFEPEQRSVYAGAVGYIDFAGNMDTCIAIRTMVVRDGRAYLQAGAGIVADSVPAREFEETENKLGALRAALDLAAHNLRAEARGASD